MPQFSSECRAFSKPNWCNKTLNTNVVDIWHCQLFLVLPKLIGWIISITHVLFLYCSVLNFDFIEFNYILGTTYNIKQSDNVMSILSCYNRTRGIACGIAIVIEKTYYKLDRVSCVLSEISQISQNFQNTILHDVLALKFPWIERKFSEDSPLTWGLGNAICYCLL